MHTKRLILRLTSLGDVILASSALQVDQTSSQLDWAIAQEYAELIEDHPRIHRLFKFNRKSGFRAWILLSRKIWENNYDEVYDLHRSLRTRLMKVLFFYWGIKEGRRNPSWKSVSKERLRL